jgi:plasmid stabilization system protein ParE
MSNDRIELLAPASTEIEEAFEWYLDRSVRAAHGFLREIDTGLSLIAQNPGLWSPYEAGTRRYLLSKYPYSIIYRVQGELIQVIAVAHHKRRPEYWRERC